MTARTSVIWEQVRAAQDHTGTTFEAHLEGTASVLRVWGQRECLVQAGRHHAVCGTPTGRIVPICSLDSPELAAEIGDEAARLVYLWSRVERACLAREVNSYKAGEDPVPLVTADGEPLPVTRQQYLDLAHLHAANDADNFSRQHSWCVNKTLEGLYPVLCSDAVARLNEYRHPRPTSRWGALRRRVRRLLSG